MKRYLILIFMSLLIISNVSAQIRLNRKTAISRLSKEHIVLPQTASNTQSGDTLVYWVLYTRAPQIFCKIVNRVGKSITGQIQLSEDGWTFGSDDILPASIAYNPLANEYLLAYSGLDASDSLNIYVRRFDILGKPIGAATNVSHDPITDPFNNNISPNVVYNPKTGGYILHWFVHAVNDIVGDSFGVDLFLDEKAKPNAPLKKGCYVDTPCYTVSTGTFLPSGKKVLIAETCGLDCSNFWIAAVNPNGAAKPHFVPINSQPLTEPFLNTYTGLTISFLPDGSGVIYFVDNTVVKGEHSTKKENSLDPLLLPSIRQSKTLNYAGYRLRLS